MPVLESQLAQQAGSLNDNGQGLAGAAAPPVISDVNPNNSFLDTIGNDLTAGAGSVISQGIQGVINAISGNTYQDQAQHQVEQQQALNNVNLGYQTQLGQLQEQNQLDLWKKTSYPAQIEQMKLAGLNPALIYGGGGGGGATVGSGIPSGASSGASDVASLEQAATAEKNASTNAEGTGAAAKLAGAQASKIGGVDTDLAKSNIEVNDQQLKLMGAGIDETHAKIALMHVQTDLAGWQLNVNEDTTQAVEQEIENKSSIVAQQLESSIADAQVAYNTQDSRIKLAKLMVAGQLIQNEANSQGIKLSKAQVWNITKQVQIQTTQLGINKQNVDQQMEILKQNIANSKILAGMNIGGNLLNGIVKGAMIP